MMVGYVRLGIAFERLPAALRPKSVGRFEPFAVRGGDGKLRATIAPQAGFVERDDSTARRSRGRAPVVSASVVGPCRGTRGSDSACASRSLRAFQRGRTQGVVAVPSEGAIEGQLQIERDAMSKTASSRVAD